MFLLNAYLFFLERGLYMFSGSYWGPNPQGGDLGDPLNNIQLIKVSIVNMGTSDNTNTKRSTVQLYLIELVLRLMDKIFYLPRFGIPSIKFKDLIIMFPPCMFKGEGQAPIPRAQMMEIIFEVEFQCACCLVSYMTLLKYKIFWYMVHEKKKKKHP